ncbi:NAD(P)-dependent oxidoreductase [Sphingomonas colocasiae]|uniref:NAD(P)-dependent oxidoreductase n=2 Tax=Sphingomonas colocasiae TaxID=1848973 RepID=A0ABS7Q048_9SPHN|nr:NAD(P)-dependent oxidoreductase [Sphingomonas colocasiae]
MVETAQESEIGFIGLGSMGSCLARRLLARNHRVAGFDPSPDAMRDFVAAGGHGAASIAELTAHAPALLLALSSFGAFQRVIDEIVAAPGDGGVVIDINTLSPDDKRAARDRLAGAGWRMLDCTISGTPEMVARDLHGFYVSGDAGAAQAVAPLIADIVDAPFDMGEFGNAAIIKLVINHMVVCHNVVAAEAMSLALKAGLDAETVYRTITASAGNSRIFEVRGRMMAEERYPPETMYQLIVDKDALVIAEMARTLRHPLPMFAPALQAHVGALSTRWANTDPASLCAVMEERSGVERRRP